MRSNPITWIVASLIAATTQLGQVQAAPNPVACAVSEICLRVTDIEGRSLSLVEIRVQNYDGSATVEISDEEGAFVLRRSDVADTDRVTFTAPGYDTVVLSGRSLAETGANVVLIAADSADAELVVTARQLSSPFATKVVDQLSLLTDPSANADVLLAAAAVPAATGIDNSADIQLRGGAIGLSRVYFNDIPLYEVVRGSAVDQVTRVSSILNPAIVKNVEVYSTNPPAYLANSASGAVRVLPSDVAAGNSLLFVGLPGVSYTTSRKVGYNGAAQIYATAADLSALLAVNPSLSQTTTNFQSVGVGGSISLPLGDDGELTALTLADEEDGRYPLRVLNLSGPSVSKRGRIYSTLSIEVPVSRGRLKSDFAITNTRNRFAFLDFDAVANNRYLYASIEHADRIGRLGYRAGLAGEHVKLVTTGSLLFYDDGAGTLPKGRLEGISHYGSAYGFLTYSASPQVTFAMGSRQFLSDDPIQTPVYSLAATWQSKDARQRLIAAGGTYSAIVLPEIGTLNKVAAARSRQVSIDYAINGRGFSIEVGAYSKSDHLFGVTTDIEGADFNGTIRPTPAFELGLILATSQQRIGVERAPNDLPLLVRANAKFFLSSTAQINARYTAKSGAVYSRLGSIGAGPTSDPYPVFEAPSNRHRLSSFQVLDLSVQQMLGYWPGDRKPIVFITISNAINRRNPARIVYSSDYSVEDMTYYEPRAITFGLVLQI